MTIGVFQDLEQIHSKLNSIPFSLFNLSIILINRRKMFYYHIYTKINKNINKL